MDARETEMAYSRALGLHLQRLRARAGLSQEAVAHRAGMSRNYYQLLEQGLSNRERESPANPTLVMLLALAAAFDVELADVIVPRDDLPSASGRTVVTGPTSAAGARAGTAGHGPRRR